MADEHLISLQPGTVIGGRYEVVKCLGAGSMGLVYACRNRELEGHMVAVKVLFPEVAQDKVAAARVRNEIFASYGVSHPNVVRAYEYLRDGDLVAYTMEFVGGGDLAERLGRGERFSVPEVVRVLSEMCSGVQAIHDAGIVHRDLKPENILLSKDGQVKIADFGIARVGHGPKLTEHGGVVGTIDYVAPEYMLNSQVDWRSDIYALGILAFEMLTGESPFRGDSVYATMTKRLKCDPEAPSRFNPGCPPELDRIVLHAMKRDPEMRYQSAGEMLQDLQRLGAELGVAVGASGAISGGGAQSSGKVTKTPVQERANPEYDSGGRWGDGSGFPMDRTPHDAPAQRGNNGKRPADWSPFERDDLEGGDLGDVDPLAETRVISEEDYKAAFQSAKAGWNSAFTSGSESRQPAEPARRKNERRGPEPRAPREPEPSDGDKILSFRNDIESTVYQPVLPPEIGVASGSIDSTRMRKLTELADRVNRSIWLDVITLVVAVFIGVGVGFGVLKVFFPELLTQSPVNIDLSLMN